MFRRCRPASDTYAALGTPYGYLRIPAAPTKQRTDWATLAGWLAALGFGVSVWVLVIWVVISR